MIKFLGIVASVITSLLMSGIGYNHTTYQWWLAIILVNLIYIMILMTKEK